jgi:ribosome-binding factor A
VIAVSIVFHGIAMPKDSRRPDRVAEAIREEVATFLAEGVKDPRIQGLVTVTGVEVTRDLRHARVFVSVMGTDGEKAATMQGLASLAGHLRGRLGRAIRLRVAPEIEFRTDPSVERAARIDSLLEQIRTQPVVPPDLPPDVPHDAGDAE